MVISQISDGSGGGNKLRIQKEGEIGVVVHTHPPINESRTGLPFRQYFTDDGTSGGSNDMRVDGSSTVVDFYISAEETKDRYIKLISIKLTDPGATFSRFGNLPALTNGLEFEWQSQKEGAITIHEGVKDIIEMYRLSDQVPTIIDLNGAGNDAVVVQWDLSKIFGSPWGIKLTQGTTEKLIFRINDDLSTGLGEFNIIGHGTKV